MAMRRVEITPKEMTWRGYEYLHAEKWESDTPISDKDLEDLKINHYNNFPITHVDFQLSPDKMSVIAHIITDRGN